MRIKLKFTTILVIIFSGFLSNKSYTLNLSFQETSELEKAKDTIAKYNELSIKAYRAGELEEFKLYAEKAYAIAETHNILEVKVKSLVHQAIYYQQTDKYDESLAKYVEAEKLTQGLPEKSYLKVMVNTNLGNLYNAIGDYDKTKEAMRKVLKLADYHDNKNDIKVVAINAIGTAELNQQNYPEALQSFEDLKGLATEMNRNDMLIRIYINISDCYRNIGDYHRAIENANEALKRNNEQESTETKALANFGLGVSYLNLENPEQALPFLKEAKQIATDGDFLKIKMESHQELAKVYEALKDVDKALVEQKQYTETREHYLSTLSKAQLMQLEQETKAKTEEISVLSKLKNVYAIIGLLLAILFLGLLFILRRRKKQFLNDTSQLILDKEFLEDENAILKDRLNAFSMRLKQKEKNIVSEKTDKKSSITQEEQEQFKERILNYMDDKKPYLNHEVKQSDIASDLGMSIHQLSENLNVCFKQNFNNFINIYRVEKVKELIKNPKYRDYKIIAIGYEAGFSSKTSFNRVFKNLVGCTPTEYQKNNKQITEV